MILYRTDKWHIITIYRYSRWEWSGGGWYFACIQNKQNICYGSTHNKVVKVKRLYLIFIADNHAEVKGFMLSPSIMFLWKLSLLNGTPITLFNLKNKHKIWISVIELNTHILLHTFFPFNESFQFFESSLIMRWIGMIAYLK